MPMMIANYLKLPNPNSYTGHTFRRTSATLLADSGADILTLKRHGGWRSNTVAEGYIENSFHNKRKICNQITNTITNKNSIDLQTSRPTTNNEPIPSTSTNYAFDNKENQTINTQTDTIHSNINAHLNEALSSSKLKNISLTIINSNVTINIPGKKD